MDQDRLRWITSPKTLDSWQVKVTTCRTPSGPMGTLWVAGSCDRKRGYLWTYTETFPLVDGSYALSDALLHVELVCEQDRPASQVEFERAMIGANWEQPELPF